MVQIGFDVLGIVCEDADGEEFYPSPDFMTVSVDLPTSLRDKHFSFTEDVIRAELESRINSYEDGFNKVVDFTAFYAGTKDPLRGNYEDFQVEEAPNPPPFSGGMVEEYANYLEKICGNHWYAFQEEYYDKMGAETLEAEDDLTFKEWADQEMKTHGGRESFDDWLDDELESHGDNVSLQDWGHHELDSHYERYGAEEYDHVATLRKFVAWLKKNNLEPSDVMGFTPDGQVLLKPKTQRANYKPDVMFIAENWGGDPEGKLALALQKAREKAKKPKKPLKIEKLDADNSFDSWRWVKPKSIGHVGGGAKYNGYVAIKGYEGDTKDGFRYRILKDPYERKDWYRVYVYDTDKLFANKSKRLNPRIDESSYGSYGENTASLMIGSFPTLEQAKRALVFRMIQDEQFHHRLTDAELHWLIYGTKPGSRKWKKAETSGQWEIGEQLEEAQMNAEFLYYYILNEKGESPADFDTLEEAQAYVANSNEPLEIYERRNRDDEAYKMDKKMNAEGGGRFDQEGGKMVSIYYQTIVDYTWRTDPDDANVDEWRVQDEVEDKIKDEMHIGDSSYGTFYAYDNETHESVEVSYSWDKTIEEDDEEIIKSWAETDESLQAEGKKRKRISGALSDPFDELSLDSGGIKSIVVGIGIGLLACVGYNKWK